MPEISLYYLNALTRLTQELLLAPDITSIPPALSVFANTLSAKSFLMLRIVYDNQNPNALEVIAKWDQENTRVDRNSRDAFLNVPLEYFTKKEWRHIQNDQIWYTPQLESQKPRRDHNTIAMPLHLEKSPSFVVVIGGLDTFSPDGTMRAFVNAAKPIFELWVKNQAANHLFHSSFDFSPNPIHAIDTEGRVTVWNNTMEKWTGWKSSRILGKGNCEPALAFYGYRRPMALELCLWPDSVWESRFLQFIRQGDSIYAEGCASLLLGGLHSKIKATKLYDINNRLWGAIGIARNITYDKMLRKDFPDTEALYQTIADFAGMGFLIFRQNDILYRNRFFNELFGLSMHERFQLSDLLNYVHPDEQDKIRANFEALSRMDNKSVRFTTQINLDCDASQCAFYCWMEEYSGRIIGQLLLRILHPRNEVFETTAAGLQKVLHTDRLISLGTMAAGITHELNQPLNTIRVITEGWQYGMQRKWQVSKADFDEDLKAVTRQVARMTDIITNIRDFARYRESVQMVSVDINELIENIVKMFHTQFDQHRIEFHKNLGQGLKSLKAPKNLLEQLIVNLLVNACEAFENSQTKARMILIRTRSHQDGLVIEVIDNATGLSEEMQDRLFKPFFTTKKGKGTGLGLAICQTIISDLGGSIQCKNNSNGGATFTVYLKKGALLAMDLKIEPQDMQ